MVQHQQLANADTRLLYGPVKQEHDPSYTMFKARSILSTASSSLFPLHIYCYVSAKLRSSLPAQLLAFML
jgi:hypothetical protein